MAATANVTDCPGQTVSLEGWDVMLSDDVLTVSVAEVEVILPQGAVVATHLYAPASPAWAANTSVEEMAFGMGLSLWYH